uniref:Uncharacterized protein LOC105644763 n=1 Tax=Rhizophora mucronata TaxID=61149 RepID=A0A2P2KDB9_RHIMU
MEELDIVIVGGGICGLATALALYRSVLFKYFYHSFDFPFLFSLLFF